MVNFLSIDEITQEAHWLLPRGSSHRAFPTQSKILSTTNIIPIYVIAKEYIDIIDERNFYSLIMNVFEDSNRLKEIKGEWNSGKAVIERINILKELCVNKLHETEYSKMEVI